MHALRNKRHRSNLNQKAWFLIINFHLSHSFVPLLRLFRNSWIYRYFNMLVNSLKHLNNEQNKTMMVHYVKVEFYLSFVKLCPYEEWNDEVIQYRVIPNLFRNLYINRCWNKFCMTVIFLSFWIYFLIYYIIALNDII